MTAIKESEIAAEIIRHYEEISNFLETKTAFRARPLKIVIDGPHSVGAGFEVSLSEKGFTRKDGQPL